MNDTHKSNLAKTAIYLLEEVEDAKFNMEDYAKNRQNDCIFSPKHIIKKYNECGTCCCFAGHAPMALGEETDHSSWEEYLDEVFKAKDQSQNWFFLFSARWSNSRHQSAARAVVLLESGVPEIYMTKDKFLSDLTDAELIERLKPFVIA